ncbi:MAG: cation diffusion facilitator family transporter [Planctomycetales bacterium]
MSHNHSHAPTNYNFAFAFGISLNCIYIAVEASYGFAIDSLALLADAGHNLSDVLGLLLAWAGYYLTGVKPTLKRTYGWRSFSILAAFLNALLLLVAMGAITWEAVQRFSKPVDVPGTEIMIVAGIGVAINFLTAVLFLRGRHDDINIQGAFLHMAADAGVSVGVVIAGFLTYMYSWYWMDPTISLLIAVIILLSTWGLLRDSILLVLHAVPPGVDGEAVSNYLSGLPEVTQVHDLHIWAMSTTETILTAHMVVPDVADTDTLLKEICETLHDRYRIGHSTIQLERSSGIGCPLEPDDSL